jgi:8-oxo-dGTP pyrophosphatase MutT (NUDIX family)
MSTPTPLKWRPPARVRPLAIGLARRGDTLLVMLVSDDHGTLKGVRPPGGTIEFMESAATALAREFQEELGTGIAIEGPMRVIENIYEHHGAPGHDIVFVYPIRLLEPALYARDRLTIDEGNGVLVQAEWFPLARIRSGEVLLFPKGLDALL